MSIRVAVEALSTDATHWEGTGRDLGAQGHAVAAIAPPALAFGTLGADVAAAYDRARQHLSQALASGSIEQVGAAFTLREVALAYLTSDEQAAIDFNNTWEIED
ncbi:hypothetical protein C8046_11535 [Serinibacter arcticus]|uniref:Uncharacterized protein n=1 Tax=Serinibacter arcticus TaxID=1655435 RepID=A0A2U1ZW16_9MICO|nr:hypothetical protein [Serinibacter arcticus]PWD51187.1 hypothetical protein C8046_11535 [Serinibacter arcticus]